MKTITCSWTEFESGYVMLVVGRVVLALKKGGSVDYDRLLLAHKSDLQVDGKKLEDEVEFEINKYIYSDTMIVSGEK